MQNRHVLYIAPLERERTGVAGYSELFEAIICNMVKKENITFVRLQETNNNVLSLKSIREAVEISSINPDLIHAEMSSSTYFEFWYTYFFSKRFEGVPLVLTIHDSPFICLNPFHGFFPKGYRRYTALKMLRKSLDLILGGFAERYLVKRASKIFVTTRGGLEKFKKRFPNACVVHLPHVSFGSSSDSREMKRVEQSTILFQGFIHKGKGVEILIEAYDKLVNELPEKKELKLVLCGWYDEKDPYFESLRALIVKSNLKGNIEITGFVSEETLLDYLKKSLCSVLPYFSKKTYSSSGALLKALSAGCPVIVSDIEMLKEYVTPGENGMIFNEGDPEDLFLKIRALIESPSKGEQLSQGAFRYVKRNHNNNDIGKCIVDAYKDLILGEGCGH